MSEDINSPAVRHFLLDTMTNGLKTEIEEKEDRNIFALELADSLSKNTLNGVFALGDEDGILIEDVESTPIGLIKVKSGIITFHMVTPTEELSNSCKAVMARSVLGTVAFAFQWHFDKNQKMPTPHSNVMLDSVEKTSEFDDDGFGMF